MNSLAQRLIDLPFWLRCLFFAVVCACLLFAGLRLQPIPEVFAQEDKLHHFIGFVALSMSCRLAFLHVRLHWIALGCVITGLLIEYAQEFMPLRSASLYDALANACGVLLGLLIAWYFTRNPLVAQ